MKKLIRKFYLAIALNPIINSMIIVAALFVVFEGSFYLITGRELNLILSFKVLIIFLVGAVFALLNKRFIKKHITVFDDKPGIIIILHCSYKLAGIYEKRFWGKMKATILEFPMGWNKDIKSGDVGCLNIEYKIDLDGFIQAVIPINLRFVFDGKLNAQNLRSVFDLKFPENFKTKTIYAEEFMEKLFVSQNNGERYEKMRDAAISYFLGHTTVDEFTEKIEREIYFSKKLFSNTSSTIMKIGKLDFEDISSAEESNLKKISYS